MTRRVLLIFGLLPLICFLIAALAFWGWYGAGADARALARHGVQTEATVTKLKIFRGLSASNRFAQAADDHMVTVRFNTGSAMANTLKIHLERRSVSKAFFLTLTEGQKLPIRYLPDAPETIEVEPGWVAGNATAAGWVGVTVALLGLVPLPFIGRAIRRLNRLKRHGLPRRGEVTDVATIDGYRTLHYRWTGRDGIVHQSRTTFSFRKLPKGDLSVGDAIDLIEDPLRPHLAMWRPLIFDDALPTRHQNP